MTTAPPPMPSPAIGQNRRPLKGENTAPCISPPTPPTAVIARCLSEWTFPIMPFIFITPIMKQYTALSFHLHRHHRRLWFAICLPTSPRAPLIFLIRINLRRGAKKLGAFRRLYRYREKNRCCVRIKIRQWCGLQKTGG